MLDSFRKCNGFKCYRKPTQQEKEYISRAVYKKSELGAMVLVLFGMISLITLFMALELMSRLYDGEELLGTGLYVLSALFLIIIILTIIELSYYASIKKGKYTLLEGTAAYYSYYSDTKHDESGNIRVRGNYYQAIKDFKSINGEYDKIPLTLKIPPYARIKSWDDGKSFPVLLIKVKGKVRYAIPDWSILPTHPKYSTCEHVRNDISF